MDQFVKVEKKGTSSSLQTPPKPQLENENDLVNLWVERYRPKTSHDIIGNSRNVRILQQWLKLYKERDPNIKRAALLSGIPGVGKTSLAKVLAEEANFEVIEFNASDTRSRKSMKDTVSFITTHGNVSKYYELEQVKPCLIIMDEVDGMSSGDKGGLSELIQIINPIRGKHSIKKSDREKAAKRWIPPVICICNNRYSKNINELVKECLDLRFDEPSITDLIPLAKKIATNENIKVSKEAIIAIVEHIEGDIRQLIALLQELKLLDRSLTVSNIKEILSIFSNKDRDIGLYEATEQLLTKRMTLGEALAFYNLDKSLIPLMIHENYPDYIENKDLETLIDLTTTLSRGDLIEKQIYTYQLWGLQSIHGIMTSCASSYFLNRETEHTKQKPIQFTSVLGKMSTYSSKRNAYLTLKEKMHNIDPSPSYLIDFLKIYLLDKLVDPTQREEGVDIMIKYKLDGDTKNRLKDIDALCKMMDFPRAFDYKKKFTAKTKTQIKKIYDEKTKIEKD